MLIDPAQRSDQFAVQPEPVEGSHAQGKTFNRLRVKK